MPTAAKLIGAMLFALLAWLVSMQIIANLDQNSGLELLGPMNALIGAVMGWRVMGARAGDGIVPAIGYGLTTVFAVTFWAILLWSAYEMVTRSVSGRYRGPMDALSGMGDLMIEYSALITAPNVIGAAVFGSLICAALTEIASHRWS